MIETVMVDGLEMTVGTPVSASFMNMCSEAIPLR